MLPEKQAAAPQILLFLDDHRSNNFAFAHRFLIEEDTALKVEVERITDGGFRIGPDEVANRIEVEPPVVAIADKP